jgi:hypothetical protein
MHDTEFNQKLAQLCRERPDFSRRLAAEYKSLQKKEAGIYEDYMSWQALHKIMDRVPALLALLKETNQDLEDWQESQRFNSRLNTLTVCMMLCSFVPTPEENEAIRKSKR